MGWEVAKAALAPTSRDCPACGAPGMADAAISRSVSVEQAPAREAVRIGYACGSEASSLEGWLDALDRVGCGQVLSEVVASRTRARPECDKALTVCAAIRLAAPDQLVILTVPELGCAARSSAELIDLAARLRADGIRLEVLDGPLAGVHEPDGMLLTLLHTERELDRRHRGDKKLEGQRAAAARGRPVGRPKVIDAAMLATALTLREEGVPVRDIAARLTVKAGANAGTAVSVASLYRALAAADAKSADGEATS